MKAIFEVKYLDVVWYDKDTILSIQESFIPLKVEFDDKQSHFICNTIIYPKAKDIKHGQLAFRFLGKRVAKPYFEKADGQRVPLKKIIDTDSGKIWWIEAGSWIKELKRWGAKTHRTAGTVSVVLGSQKCQVDIGSSEFTSEQLNRYLSDFKSDLWELILDEESYVTGKAKRLQDGGVSEESIQLINNLLSHAQNILKKPKSELREIQILKPRKMVKPVNRTFMELATKGDGKYLTSRATEASYNVPENRYVLFALGRVHIILKQLVTISKSKINRFESAVTKLNERLGAFTDVRKINKDLVRKDLKKIRMTYDLDHLNRQLENKLKTYHNDLNEHSNKSVWYIKVGGLAKNKKDVFFGVKIRIKEAWFEHESGLRVVFLNYAEEFYRELFEQGLEYEICGDMTHSEETKTVCWYTYTLSNLTSVKVIGGENIAKRKNKFQSVRKKAISFVHSGWNKPLNSRERREQEKEKVSVKIRLRFYEENQSKVQHVYTLLEPKLIKFRNLLTQFKKLGIKPSATFPNSMTFVQNPDYQSIHSGYKKIRELTNLTDEDLLLSLEKVDEIGLINMPILYERWCLLQIIKVLVQNYHYRPSHDWKRRLVKIVTTGKHNDSLDFNNSDVKRNIQLRYEPTLDNGRMPDYVMDVNFERKNGKKYTKRFVMDAKFYSNDILKKSGGISGVVHHLYHEKNYSEDGKNAVFILHPAKGAIDEIVSPQAWGKYSYLGELEMFEWDKTERTLYHQYGAICVNPALRLNYLDEFQRMIGMFLQYGVEDNTLCRDSDDDAASINFCIACGSHDLKPLDTSGKNRKSRWYECNVCQHFTTYNHCFSCNTRLIKNGDYWSYHSQMPMEPLNIKCPACESLL